MSVNGTSTSNSDEGLIGSARERAIEAYDGARESAAAAGRKASDTVADAPMIALTAGLAAGALIAALLPKTRVEEKLLGPVGGRIGDAGRAAVDAAKSAGREALSERNLTRDAGAGLVQKIVDGLGEAARSSGEAALGAVRGDR
jgi:hypothetical protein